MDRGDQIELTIEKVVAGGDGLARAADGRVVMVSGGIPGERVTVSVTKAKRDLAFADVLEVLDASPDRVEPPCPHVARGCGGCDWQHIAPIAQARFKRDIVVDALARIARLPDANVAPTVELPAEHYRQRVRFVVDNGRAAFRKVRTNEPVPVDSCLVLHEKLEQILVATDWSASREAELAYGIHTNETLRVAPTRNAPERTGTYHEVVAGHRFRISARSFFQIRTDGAEALVDLVRTALGDDIDALADLYAGVGLFATTIPAAHVVAIESNPSAVADCRHNLAEHPDAKIHRVPVERWRAKRTYDAVVADPSRAGLGVEGVESVVRCKPQRIALVSCDVAAMARDIRALLDAGYRLESSTPVDLFPMTSHIEIVSALARDD
jgi:23S rRNA (uracil1939-C5)-methyltransferase